MDDRLPADEDGPDWLGLAAVGVGIETCLSSIIPAGGWAEAAFGRSWYFLWFAELLWLALSVLAISRRRSWWVLLAAPFALYAPAMSGLLLLTCMRGTCL